MKAESEKVWSFHLVSEVGICYFSLTGPDVLVLEPTLLAAPTKLETFFKSLKFQSGQPVKVIGKADAVQKVIQVLQKFFAGKIDSVTFNEGCEAYFYGDTGRLRMAETQPTSRVLPEIKVERKMKVLIVDDSPTIRKVLSHILTEDNRFEVAGQAANVSEAEQILAKTSIDVITLDIHMPGMDGLTYLKSLQGKKHPPVVLISSISADDAINVFKCLELGAVDYIEKPSGGAALDGTRIRDIVFAASTSKTRAKSGASGNASIFYSPRAGIKDLIVIGASTGGVEAIREVLTPFPPNCPPVMIVQHIPPYFSKAFADRLREITRVNVTEANGGESLEEGHVYIAPGGKQMRLRMEGRGPQIEITDDAPVNRFKPSVDYMFDSIVEACKYYRVSSALLTGMGRDGAEGLLKLKNAGAHTIAESEETAIVFGMPREAIKLNAATEILPLKEVAHHLFMGLQKVRSHKGGN